MLNSVLNYVKYLILKFEFSIKLFNFAGYHNPNLSVFSSHVSRATNSDIRRCHSRNHSLDLRHSRNSSADLNKYFKSEINILNSVGTSGKFFFSIFYFALSLFLFKWLIEFSLRF